MVHGFAEKDHIELLRRGVFDEISTRKLVFLGPPVFFRPFSRFLQASLGNIDPQVALVGISGQFVGCIARAAPKIQNVSVGRVSFEVGIDAVVLRVIRKVPFVSRVLFVPKDPFQTGWAVALEGTVRDP